MSEALLTIEFVVAVFGLPSIVGVWWELCRERTQAEQRERQRRFEEDRREQIRRSGSPPSGRAWPGIIAIAGIL